MDKQNKYKGRLPGDLSREELIERIIRVDQAGEYGAKRIYEGQLAVLAGTPDETVLREMADVEEQHLDTFNALMVERQVRPTILAPLWHVAGFALGVDTDNQSTQQFYDFAQVASQVVSQAVSQVVSQVGSQFFL